MAHHIKKKGKLDGARRLLDLEVREVSLVDRPAIKREFVLIKSMAEDGNTEAAALVEEFRKRFGDAVDFENIGTEKEEPTFEEARKSVMDEGILKQLGLDEHYDLCEIGVENLPSTLREQLQKVSDGLEAANVDGIDQAIGFLSTILKGKLPVPKGEEMTISNQELGAAQGGVEVDKNASPAVEPQDTTVAEESQATETEVAKEDEQQETVQREKVVEQPQDVGPAPAIQVFEDGSVAINGQTVAKGRTFTQSRIDALVGNIEQLADLMSDVAPEQFAELVDKLASQLPTSPKYRQGVTATPAPGPKKDKPRRGTMMKNEDGEESEVMKALSELTKSVQTITEKVETFEKARSPSTSVTEDGGTDDPQEVEKNATPGSSAFWKGTLY